MHESLATQRTLESFDSMYSSMRSPNTAYPDADSEFDLKQNGTLPVSLQGFI